MCEYCEGENPYYIHPFAFDEEFEVLVLIKDEPEMTHFVVHQPVTDDEACFDIHFCPMCGRDLRDNCDGR